MPVFICPNCRERSVDVDGVDGFSGRVPQCRSCGFGFLFQLLDGSMALVHPQEGGGVAFFAHIGGFAFGFLVVKLLQKRHPLRPTH